MFAGTCVLLAALAAGLVVALRMRSETDAMRLSDTPIEDLDERAEHLMELMREMNGLQAKMVPEAYAAEKTRLEKEAASALRMRDEKLKEIEQMRKDSAGSKYIADRSQGQGFWASRPQLKGFLWGVGAVGVALGVYSTLDEHVAPRSQPPSSMGKAGQSSVSPGESVPQPPHSGELASLLEQLQKSPDDVDAMNRLTRILLKQQMFAEAKSVNERVKQIDSNNRGARLHSAVLLGAEGDTPAALEALALLVKELPKYADAWFFRGMLAMQSSQGELMRESFEKFVEHAPDSPRRERIRKMLNGEGMTMPPRAAP